MRSVDIIQRKRDGHELKASELNFLIDGYMRGDVTDYQMSAFTMAVFFRGMSGPELAAFTDAMLHSGRVLDLSFLKTFCVDKHSTGGVGDKISIPLAPAVAACGLVVPMVSGRGLGHTGGTLDKLESIPGFRVNLSVSDFFAQLSQVGCSLIGQTEEVAPADKKLYALRDVSGTVECIPLIASSIMSKKLAEGVHGLVLDVKYGSGAFLPPREDALKLASAMVDIGTRMGTQMVARLTSAEQPIGVMTGNALEIAESLDVLDGKGPADVVQLVVELGAEMLVMGGVADRLEQGRAKIQQVLKDGSARKKFAEIVKYQGGDVGIFEDRSLLSKAQKQVAIKAKTSGFLAGIDARMIGTASMTLGGGRQKVEDRIDPAVGIETLVRVGDAIHEGQTLFVMHSNNRGDDAAKALIEKAVTISHDPVLLPPLFGERITKNEL